MIYDLKSEKKKEYRKDYWLTAIFLRWGLLE